MNKNSKKFITHNIKSLFSSIINFQKLENHWMNKLKKNVQIPKNKLYSKICFLIIY